MGLFSKKKSIGLPNTPQIYPSGVCVESEAGRFYINGKFRHKIESDRILRSWAFPFVSKTTEAALAKYLKAKPLGFRDGTIVRAISDGKLYIISQREKRPITNPDVLDRLGLTAYDVLWVSDDELKLHKEGEVIN